jgi:transcriptional regulator with XRE-family HTH domain
MMKTLKDKLAEVGPERRKKIEERAAYLVAEEKTLRDLRKALELTQEGVAERLHITQDGVSRLESRTDLLISTLRNVVQAMGGRLRLVAEFPDRPPIEVAGFAAMENARRKRERERERQDGLD